MLCTDWHWNITSFPFVNLSTRHPCREVRESRRNRRGRMDPLNDVLLIAAYCKNLETDWQHVHHNPAAQRRCQIRSFEDPLS